MLLCCCSVVKLCLTLSDPMNCSTPGFPVHHQLLEPAQTRVHRVGDAIQPAHPVTPFSYPQSFPASGSFPMSRFFRWPKYWSFNFTISPFDEYSGLISFRIDGFDLLAVQGPLFCCSCSVAKSFPYLYDPMDCNTPGSSVCHSLPEFAQIHVH